MSETRPVSILRWPAVKARVGLSRTTVWRLQRRGLFPKPVVIGVAAAGWRSDDIDRWLETRVTR